MYHDAQFRKCKFNRLQSNSVEFKNKWSFTYTSPMYVIYLLQLGFHTMAVVIVPPPIYRGQRKHYFFICRFYALNIVLVWRWLACFTRHLPRVRFKNIKSESLFMSTCHNSTTDALTLRFSPFLLPALFVTVTVIVESTSKQSAISRETRLKKNSTCTCGNADPI